MRSTIQVTSRSIGPPPSKSTEYNTPTIELNRLEGATAIKTQQNRFPWNELRWVGIYFEWTISQKLLMWMSRGTVKPWPCQWRKPYILHFGAGSEATSGFHKDSMKIYTGPGIDKSDREVTRLTQVMRLEDDFSLHK